MNKGQPLLSVRGLNAWYGESHALHGVDLDIWPGETITLLGRNGVGKTTTLRAIMGIIRKRTGTITLEGKDIMRVPLHRIAHAGLGFVPEERGIFATLSVHENLLLPPVVAKVGQGGGQSLMSLDEIYALFPNLHERRNSPGTKLSGGEQQMLAIARILRTGVKVLLLDEPTEGLAPVIVQRIGDDHPSGRAELPLCRQGRRPLLSDGSWRGDGELPNRRAARPHGGPERSAGSLT